MDYRTDVRTDVPEYGADATPSSSSEYLRALKSGTEIRAPLSPASSVAAPSAISTTQPSPSPARDKRRSPRYKCEGSAEFRTEGIEVRTWARVTDISRNGCYVEMQATLAVGTAVSMVLEISEIRVQLKGTVKTSYPLLGMGIEFTDVEEDDQARLEELLLTLAGGVSPRQEFKSRQPSPAAPDLLMIMDAGAALNAVAKFFQSNQALSREQFTDLIGKSQTRDREQRR